MLYSCRLLRRRWILIWVGPVLIGEAIALLISIVISASAMAPILSFFYSAFLGLLYAIPLTIICAILNINFLLFPPLLEIYSDKLSRKDRSWFGRRINEASVPFAKIAVVRKEEGLFFTNIRVQTTGGETSVVGGVVPSFPELFRSDSIKALAIIEEQREKYRTATSSDSLTRQ